MTSIAHILVVDDDPFICKLLARMLASLGYCQVTTHCTGLQALKWIDVRGNAPDLILTDINMPEMNGYQFCVQFKEREVAHDIPVIFISTIDSTAEIVKAFECGGNDYITKPFRIEEVKARVETQLKLRMMMLAERELLEKTLTGTVSMLVNLMNLSLPPGMNRVVKVTKIIAYMTGSLGITDTWQYEMAASLFQIGCITLPTVVLSKVAAGLHLSAAEEKLYQQHPAIGRRLLANIPRLEAVAEMIGRQRESANNVSARDPVQLGARLLHIAFDMANLIDSGMPVDKVIETLRSSPQVYDPGLLATLGQQVSTGSNGVMQVPLKRLRPGMVVDEDVYTLNGVLLISQGEQLTGVTIERLNNFARLYGVKDSVRVITASD